jgi:hypothetical protein
MALIYQREDIALSMDSQPESWLLIEIEEGKTPYTKGNHTYPSAKKMGHYAMSAYMITYEIEHLFREIVSGKFPDIDNLLNNITVQKLLNQKELLYEALRRKRDTEKSKLLDGSLSSDLQLIDYMDWNDWIILFKEKWSDFFPFNNQPEAMKSFIRILEQTQPIRNKVAHMREVTSQDIESLRRTRDTIKSLKDQMK